MCGGKNKPDPNNNQPQQNQQNSSPPPSIFLGPVPPSEESLKSSKIMHVKKMLELRSFYNNAGEKLVVVDFYATWCQPCQRIAPILEQWVDTYQNDVTFVKVNVDSCDQDLIVEYNITSVPTFIFARKGQVVAQFTGGKYQELKALLEKNRSGMETEPPKKTLTTATLLREGIRALKLQEGRNSRKNTNEGEKNDRKGSKRASRPSEDRKKSEGGKNDGEKKMSRKSEDRKKSDEEKNDGGKKMSRKSEDRKKSDEDKNEGKRKSIISLRRHSSKHSTKSKKFSTESEKRASYEDSGKPKKSDGSGGAKNSTDGGNKEENTNKSQKNSLDSTKEKTSIDSD